jgi:hypothetical protein
MLGNMGPKEKWIWENIYTLFTNIDNGMQQEKHHIVVFF